MTEQEVLWKNVEESAPDDPLPLLVFADYAAERADWPSPWLATAYPHIESVPWADVEYAMRWCAARKRRAYRRTDVIKPQWGWVTEKNKYRTLGKAVVRARSAAVLPHHLAQIILSGLEWDSWTSSVYAYDELASGLVVLREEVDVPDLQLPPPKVNQLPGVALCPECGVAYSQTKLTCPACHTDRKE